MNRKLSGIMASALMLAACNAILGNEEHYRLDSTSAAGNSSSAGVSSNAGKGGGAAEAGQGSGGEPGPCEPTGAEDCFNGIDDDCNGMLDCADPMCGEDKATCVPAPAGGGLGLFVEPGEECPNGYTHVTLHTGLHANGHCDGCSCDPLQAHCEGKLQGLNCTTQQAGGPDYTLTGASNCDAVAIDSTSFRSFSVIGIAECTPKGTPRLSQAEWAETREFCQLDRLGKGCEVGKRCAAATTTPTCSTSSDNETCGADYPMNTGEWATTFTDDRSCPAQCGCALGMGTCNSANVTVYSNQACSGEGVLAGYNTETDTCSNAFKPLAAKLSGAPSSNTCPVDAPTTGDLKPDDNRTICCQ